MQIGERAISEVLQLGEPSRRGCSPELGHQNRGFRIPATPKKSRQVPRENRLLEPVPPGAQKPRHQCCYKRSRVGEGVAQADSVQAYEPTFKTPGLILCCDEQKKGGDT